MSRIKQIIDSYMGRHQTETVRKEFAEWLEAPQDANKKQRTMQNYWDALEAEMPQRQIADAYSSTAERIRRRNSLRPRRSVFARISRVAAVVALPIMAAALTYSVISRTFVPKTDWQEVYAPYGETRSVVLADGSHITLNSGSRLIYPDKFSGDERHVFLAGEAYADIAKDAEHKFILSAGDIDITVHGTEFNVRSYSDDSEVEVALVSGSIDMTTKNLEINRSIRMTPGDMAKLDKRTGEIASIRFPNGTFDRGTNGNNLTFINSRLCDIAAQLERTFDVKIIIDSDALADERYYSAFVNGESIEDILSAWQLNDNVRHRREGNTIHLYKSKK